MGWISQKKVNFSICCFSKKFGFARVDDVKWKEGTLFSLQLWDLYSDVFFAISCGNKAERNEYRDLDVILLVGSIGFILIPYIANLVPFSFFFFFFFACDVRERGGEYIEGCFDDIESFERI